MCVNPEIHISPQAKEGRKERDRPLSVSFLFCTSGISQSSWLDQGRDGMDAQLRIFDRQNMIS